MKRLDGKVAIITGGARGIGASNARKFVSEGAKVVITDILEQEGLTLARDLGENAKFMKHDVTSAADWDRVVSETEAAFGPVNVLINNAGIVLINTIEGFSEEEYRKVIDINQVSVFLGMKAVISSMRKTKNGSIVNISSVAGMIGILNHIAYTGSKFAVRGMTKAAALEFAKYNIRVNSVHPGLIETPLIGDPQDLQSIIDSTPLKRVGQPEEVSNLVLFLSSDESSYSTGSEFIVDGGHSAQ